MPRDLLNPCGLFVATLLLGCPTGDDGSAATEGETDASTGTTAATAASSPTSAASLSSSGTSTTESETVGSEVTGDVSTGTTAPAESSSGGSTGTTGAVDPCAGLDRQACADDESCEPIVCGGFMMTNDGATPWCMTEPAFIGCRSTDLDCAMEPTFTCEGDDAPIYVCREDCIPEGFMICASPVDNDVPPCD